MMLRSTQQISQQRARQRGRKAPEKEIVSSTSVVMFVCLSKCVWEAYCQ